MAHNNWNAPAFGNVLSKKNDKEEGDHGDQKPAAKPTSLSKRDREPETTTIQHKLIITPVEQINKEGQQFKPSAAVAKREEEVSKEGQQLKPSAAAAKRDEDDQEASIFDAEKPASIPMHDNTRQEESSESFERSIHEAQQQQQGESSNDESSIASSFDNVARLPSDDEASLSSTYSSDVSLPPLRAAAPVLPPTLLRPANPEPILSQGVSVERIRQLVLMDTMQAEIQTMIQQRRNIQPTSNNTDVAALNYIETRVNYNDDFDDAVHQVNHSFNMEHLSGNLEQRHDDVNVSDLTAAMNSLNITGYPTMSDEEIEIDKAIRTNAEKASALSDLYGKFYSTENNGHANKKAKRDLDQRSLEFLVLQMRIEVDLIPLEKKAALVEVLSKCRQEEFSNARLLAFLRSEGMNTKLAAIRFVNYWEARRDLFGPDKYYLRMTLSEALRDDIAALKTGVCTILPFKDMSGRPLCFFETARITRQGYTPQSMVRVIWYIIEILVRESNDPECTFVRVFMEKYNSLPHYDGFIVRHVPYYFRACWPVRNLPSHKCCPSLFMRKVGRPLIYASMSKENRARLLIHDVPDSDIIETLSQYGIMAHMLPINMGGQVDLDVWVPQFIEQRRAIEMEEI